MAEEETREQDDAGNFDRVQQFIRSQVQTYMQEELAARQSQYQQQPAPNEAREQLREVLQPFIEPVIIQSAGTEDESRFYRRNPQAADYEEQIEKMFAELRQQGRHIPRQDIYDVLVGREYRADPQKFTEKQAAKHKEQVEHAASGIDFGAATFAKAKSDPTWANFSDLSVEDMEKALDGITF